MTGVLRWHLQFSRPNRSRLWVRFHFPVRGDVSGPLAVRSWPPFLEAVDIIGIPTGIYAGWRARWASGQAFRHRFGLISTTGMRSPTCLRPLRAGHNHSGCATRLVLPVIARTRLYLSRAVRPGGRHHRTDTYEGERWSTLRAPSFLCPCSLSESGSGRFVSHPEVCPSSVGDHQTSGWPVIRPEGRVH
jgi:hypothetical protein